MYSEWMWKGLLPSFKLCLCVGRAPAVQVCKTDVSSIVGLGIFPQFGLYLCREWSDFLDNFIVDVSLDKEVPI